VKDVFCTYPASIAIIGNSSPNLDGGVPSSNYGGIQTINGGAP
jgi:hypothetical protein